MTSKIILRNILFALLLLGSSASLSFSSNIPLEGAKALPGQYITISLDRLYNKVVYNVTCAIHADGKFSSNSIHYIETFTKNGVPVLTFIDNKRAEYPSVIPQPIKSNGSVLEFRAVTNRNIGLMIRNLDYTDTLLVHDCVANIVV